MPIYQYQPVKVQKKCHFCRTGFEIIQRMSENQLSQCPQCGTSVRRVISACSINTRTISSKTLLSDRHLKKHGFTKLVKEAKGKYRKTV